MIKSAIHSRPTPRPQHPPAYHRGRDGAQGQDFVGQHGGRMATGYRSERDPADAAREDRCHAGLLWGVADAER